MTARTMEDIHFTQIQMSSRLSSRVFCSLMKPELPSRTEQGTPIPGTLDLLLEPASPVDFLGNSDACECDNGIDKVDLIPSSLHLA